MKNSFRIALDVILEARRNQIYLLTLFFAVVLGIGCSMIFGVEPSLRQKILVESGVSLIWFLHFVLALFFVNESVYNDIQQKSIYYYLVRDVSRFQYLVGKFLGFWGAISISVIFSCLVLAGGAMLVGGNVERILAGCGFVVLEFSLVISLLMFFSLIFSKLISVFVFLLVWFFTSIVEHFLVLDAVPEFMKFILALVPNFKYYAYIEMITHGKELSIEYTVFLLGYTLCFTLLLLMASSLHFNRRAL
jgi:ABC-type transport system involved in multi-copper enzyme maturation permease subunit